MPRWFAAALCAGASAVAGTGLAGVVLAVAGRYEWWAALLAGLLAGALGARAGWRAVPPGAASRWAAAAVAVSVAFVAANWQLHGESVVLERDPGLYTATARWLDREGSLLVDADPGPFADTEGVSFLSVGMYEHGSSLLEFQANHLTGALFATGYGAAGAGGMFRVPLLLTAGGLLAVYALAARWTGRGAAALAAMGALAVSLPVLGVARDTLSEPGVLLLLWTGLWLWTTAVDGGRPATALAAGVLVGTCVAARIDAAAYLVPVPIVLALHRRSSGPRLVRPFVAGLVPGVAVAALDVGFRARGYLLDLDVEVALLYALLTATTAAAVLLARRQRPLPRVNGDLVAGAVVGLLLLAWFARPHLQTVRAGDSELIRAIQSAQGEAVDGTRRYHERSMAWQSWYLGAPLLAAAIGGAAVALRRLARGADRALLLPLAALGASTALYLYRPAISPDHLWAMRRFVPAALPLWCVLAAVAGVTAIERLADRRAQVAAGLAAAAVAIAPVAWRTWPVREFREFDGFLTAVVASCDTVGPDAAVVLPEGSYPGAALTQSIRSWCGVPAAVVDGSVDLAALGDAWSAQGRQLWLVEPAPAGAGIAVSTDRMLEDTLTSPPDEYFTHELRIRAVPVTRGGGA